MYSRIPPGGVVICLLIACVSGQRDIHSDDSPVAGTETAAPDTEQVARSSRTVKTLAVDRLGDRVRYIPNASNTYILCVGESPAITGKIFKPSGDIRFFVYCVETESIIFEDAVDATSVSWEDDTHIKVAITPGTVQTVDIQEHGYRYDVISGMKETLPSITPQ